MKYFLLLSSFLLLIVASCTKKDKEENPYARYDSTLYATRNGEPVRYKLGAFYDSTGSTERITLLIVDYHDNRTWDHIAIGNILTKTGKDVLINGLVWSSKKPELSLLPFLSYNTSFNSGQTDILTTYYLGTEPTASITINSYNKADHEISGTFEAAIRLDKSNTNNPYKPVDSVVYRNATFSVKIHDRAYFGY